MTNEHIETAKALMTVALMAADADGRLKRRELERLRMLAAEHPAFRELASVDLFIHDRAQELRADGGEAAIARAAAVLSPRMRETAYAIAVELAIADGGTHPGEHALLTRLGKAFNIPGPLARKIRAVTEIRRRIR